MSIHHLLYGAYIDANKVPLTAMFDYKWNVVKQGQFQRAKYLTETIKRWMD